MKASLIYRTALALILGSCLCATQPVNGAAGNERLNRFKAVFVYNFIDYVHWPSERTSGAFKVGILGASAIEQPLREIAEKKRAWGQPLQIEVFTSIRDLRSCNLLFVSPEFSSQVADLSLRLSEMGVLLIADAPGMAAQGASINFVLEKGKLKFEVNRDSLERAGLKASAQLLKLAILVSSAANDSTTAGAQQP